MMALSLLLVSRHLNHVTLPLGPLCVLYLVEVSALLIQIAAVECVVMDSVNVVGRDLLWHMILAVINYSEERKPTVLK